MDKLFHLCVRRHPGVGYTVSILTHPHLSSFAEELPAARADVSRVVTRLLEHGELWDETTFWPDLRQRRMDLVIRAVQHARLLPVPMRFSVLTRSLKPELEAPGKARRPPKGPLHVQLPRLDVSGIVHDPRDLDVFLEELVRHELFMAPLSRLMEVAYTGDESVETLTVSAKPRAAVARKKEREPSRPSAHRPMPSGLGEACRRLNDEARAGLLGRAYQRDRELALLAETLDARTRASALLIGPTSVGKTALLHELACRVEEGGDASPLRGLELYSTSGNRIVAGMRYLGQWQERVTRMIEELRVRRAVLHLESLGELLSTGDSQSGLDIARHLLPAIESGEISVVCEATPEDLARAERSHALFVQALRPMVIAPLEPAAARLALGAAAQRIARARKVRFDDEALDRAVDLAERFGEAGAVPGGAIELLRAAAYRDRPAEAGKEKEPRVSASDVTVAFSARTGYPRELVDPAVRLDPDAVLRHFRERVVGQDAATLLLRNLVVTLKTGLADPARPLGSFLFLGPTGVGKTESALALTHYLFGDDKRLVRFDMSEYAAPGSALRLVNEGAGREGALARRVREQPFGVVLLDEVEKADPGVHDLLLQILGEGRLTDATGRTVRFHNTVVILTSNLGADSAGRSLGFGEGTVREAEAHYVAAATAFFRPELLNRLDQIVPFRPLSRETIERIARKALEAALAREGLVRRGVTVTYGDEVVGRLAEIGFDARYGARPLKRAIEQWVIAPLAQRIAAGSARKAKELRLRVSASGAVELEG